MPVQSISPVTATRVAAFLGADGFSPYAVRNNNANTANAISASPQRIALQSSLPISVTGVLFDARVSGLSGLVSRESPLNQLAATPYGDRPIFAR